MFEVGKPSVDQHQWESNPLSPGWLTLKCYNDLNDDDHDEIDDIVIMR